jgi:hypothetical protein
VHDLDSAVGKATVDSTVVGLGLGMMALFTYPAKSLHGGESWFCCEDERDGREGLGML